MRTTMELDDELMRQAQQFSSARTKSALIEEVLRTFIEEKKRENDAKRTADTKS